MIFLSKSTVNGHFQWQTVHLPEGKVCHGYGSIPMEPVDIQIKNDKHHF